MRSIALAGAIALLLASPAGLAAQTPQRMVVLTEPGTPVIAAEFLLSVGPSDEPERYAGLAHLSAQSLLAPLLGAFDSLGVHVGVTAQKDALSFSLISAPDAWKEATELLATALFREPPDSLAVVREKAQIIEELAGRASNPADAATRDLDRAFFGIDHPWGRPTIGTPQTLERITLAVVDTFLRANFTPDRAFAAVAGPVEEADAREHLLPLLGSTFPASVDLIPFRSAERPVRREYDSITTWVSASFRFPETGDEEALRVVSYLIADALSFSPSQRSVYNVWTQVVPRIGGGEIRVQVVVPPEEAEAWAERVGEVVTSIASERMVEDVFEGHVRRYRGQRAMQLAAPEDRAHAAVRQLLVRGGYSTLLPEPNQMTQERIRDAARSLSEPTLVVLGPIID